MPNQRSTQQILVIVNLCHLRSSITHNSPWENDVLNHKNVLVLKEAYEEVLEQYRLTDTQRVSMLEAIGTVCVSICKVPLVRVYEAGNNSNDEFFLGGGMDR